MRLLHFYNPDTDYALAAGEHNYTPPESIRRVRARNALLPLQYMAHDDAILVIDNDAIIPQETKAEILHLDSMSDWSSFRAAPWGWNHTVARFFFTYCPGITGIPSSEMLSNLRQLAHRRTATLFLTEVKKSGRFDSISLPLEFQSVDEAYSYYESKRDDGLFFKAPWSSSGRGILFTAGVEDYLVKQWLSGTIAKQGSVMAEAFYPKTIDCATEWMIVEGKPCFLGVSLFEASRRGKYHKNICGSQKDLRDRIGILDDDLIAIQSEALRTVVGKRYEGPLGIDMIVMPDNRIHPCLEINFRHTMGSILINN